MIASGAPLLLDANIVLLLTRRGTAGQRLDERFQLSARKSVPLISVITVGELLALALRNGWGAPKVTALRALLENLVIIDVNREAILQAYATIDAHLASIGRSIGQNDRWIAATAAAYRAVLITTDRDFDALDPDHIQREWVVPATLR